jgi:hypothetical protein
MKKRAIFFVWTLIAMAVISSGVLNMYQLKIWIPMLTPEGPFDEVVAEAKEVRTHHLVQRQDILKENTNSSPLSSKETETERLPSLRHPVTITSQMRKEQVNVSSSGKTSAAPSSLVFKEQARVQPRTVFLQGSPWTRSPVSVAYVLKGSETKGDAAYRHTSTATTIKKFGRLIKDCKFIGDWQKSFHPSCNDFHDTNLVDTSVDNGLKMLGNGKFRQGMKVTHPHNNTQTVWKVSK